MTIGLPQIIWLGLMVLSLGMSLANHDKPKTGYENFWISLIAFGVHFALLSWGGFFG